MILQTWALCVNVDGQRVNSLHNICAGAQGDHVLSVSTMCGIINVITLQQFKQQQFVTSADAVPHQSISDLSGFLKAMHQMTNADIQLVMRDVNYLRAFEFHWLKEGCLWGATCGKPARDHCMP